MLDSHIYVPKSILNRFRTIHTSGRQRITFYDFKEQKIKTKGAGKFHTELNYYLKDNEQHLRTHVETPLGQTIRYLELSHTNHGTNFHIEKKHLKIINSYIVYQLLRDHSVFRICKKENVISSELDEKTFKNLLINNESNQVCFSEMFSDAGIQLVFNNTSTPFLLTSGITTFDSDIEKNYIMQITLAPEIAILLTNYEPFKQNLKVPGIYGIIDYIDDEHINKYNQPIFLKAKKYFPHILVSRGEQAIVKTLDRLNY